VLHEPEPTHEQQPVPVGGSLRPSSRSFAAGAGMPPDTTYNFQPADSRPQATQIVFYRAPRTNERARFLLAGCVVRPAPNAHKTLHAFVLSGPNVKVYLASETANGATWWRERLACAIAAASPGSAASRSLLHHDLHESAGKTERRFSASEVAAGASYDEDDGMPYSDTIPTPEGSAVDLTMGRASELVTDVVADLTTDLAAELSTDLSAEAEGTGESELMRHYSLHATRRQLHSLSRLSDKWRLLPLPLPPGLRVWTPHHETAPPPPIWAHLAVAALMTALCRSWEMGSVAALACAVLSMIVTLSIAQTLHLRVKETDQLLLAYFTAHTSPEIIISQALRLGMAPLPSESNSLGRHVDAVTYSMPEVAGLSPRDARVIRWRNRLEMCCTMNPVPASSTESAEIARDASANEVAMPVFDYLLRVVPHTDGSGRSVVIQTLRYRIGGYACASARLATAVGLSFISQLPLRRISHDCRPRLQFRSLSCSSLHLAKHACTTSSDVPPHTPPAAAASAASTPLNASFSSMKSGKMSEATLLIGIGKAHAGLMDDGICKRVQLSSNVSRAAWRSLLWTEGDAMACCFPSAKSESTALCEIRRIEYSIVESLSALHGEVGEAPLLAAETRDGDEFGLGFVISIPWLGSTQALHLAADLAVPRARARRDPDALTALRALVVSTDDDDDGDDDDDAHQRNLDKNGSCAPDSNATHRKSCSPNGNDVGSNSSADANSKSNTDVKHHAVNLTSTRGFCSDTPQPGTCSSNAVSTAAAFLANASLPSSSQYPYAPYRGYCLVLQLRTPSSNYALAHALSSAPPPAIRSAATTHSARLKYYSLHYRFRQSEGAAEFARFLVAMLSNTAEPAALTLRLLLRPRPTTTSPSSSASPLAATSHLPRLAKELAPIQTQLPWTPSYSSAMHGDEAAAPARQLPSGDEFLVAEIELDAARLLRALAC